MKLLSVTKSPIVLIPIKERWYEVAEDARCILRTDCGCIYAYVHKGFRYDGRSGGKLVDWISPNLGTPAENWAYLMHDIHFYGFGLTFETTNDLLKQQLMLDAKYSSIRASIIKWGVDTDFARKSFEANTPEDVINKQKLHWEWMDDNRGYMIAQAIDFSDGTELRQKYFDLSRNKPKMCRSASLHKMVVLVQSWV